MTKLNRILTRGGVDAIIGKNLQEDCDLWNIALLNGSRRDHPPQLLSRVLIGGIEPIGYDS